MCFLGVDSKEFKYRIRVLVDTKIHDYENKFADFYLYETIPLASERERQRPETSELISQNESRASCQLGSKVTLVTNLPAPRVCFPGIPTSGPATSGSPGQSSGPPASMDTGSETFQGFVTRFIKIN